MLTGPDEVLRRLRAWQAAQGRGQQPPMDGPSSKEPMRGDSHPLPVAVTIRGVWVEFRPTATVVLVDVAPPYLSVHSYVSRYEDIMDCARDLVRVAQRGITQGELTDRA